MSLRTFSWQHLGAFVVNIGDCLNSYLDQFQSVGGAWVIPVLHNDVRMAAENRARMPGFITRCHARGIRVGAWLNGFGDNPADLAFAAKLLTTTYGPSLAPIVFDMEASYKDANAPLLPATLAEARRMMPTRPIGVSSFGFADRAMIWNGRTLYPPASLYDQKVRWMPQWYTVYDGRYAPDWSMRDLWEHGASDFNIADSSAPGGRGIPLSYAHGTLEATGVEGSSLADGLRALHDAKQWGFTRGFSIYVLERTPETDFALLAAERGSLYL